MNTLKTLQTLGLVAILALTLTFPATADDHEEPEAPASPAASVSQTIGIDTQITIAYHRPGVKGRKIWGDLVPNDAVWRAGANQTTKISFSKDVKVNGKTVEAGDYGLHIIPKEKGAWTVIINYIADGWGSYDYNEEKDLLRLDVTPEKASHQENLAYGFDTLTPAEAPTTTHAFLHWAKLKLSLKVEATD